MDDEARDRLGRSVFMEIICTHDHRSPGRWGVRFYEAPVARDQPAIWVDHGGEQFPVIRRSDVNGYPHVLWPHIVRALTAGPTLESARVVVETLREENQALLRANAELNDELSALRRVGA